MMIRTVTLAAALALTSTALAPATEFSNGPFANELDYQDKRRGKTEVMSSAQAIGLMRAVELHIDDQVDDGCWGNRDAVFDRVRSALIMAGIAVHTEPMEYYDVISPQINLSLIGYRMPGGACVAHMTLDVGIVSRFEMGSLTYTDQVFNISSDASLWKSSTIFSGQKLDELALKSAATYVDRLIDSVRIGRNDPIVQRFNEVWPAGAPLTRAQAAN
jgi:hypothetical protein